MSFDVPAKAYARSIGRYSEPLAAEFAEWVGVRPGSRALDVGCGPGALTAHLVQRVGVERVLAIDPSPAFVAAAQARFPGLDVRSGAAEQLPYPDDSVDFALAQLVVHFMTDPVQGLREMGRVTRGGGTVAACVWDHAGGGSPLSLFWRAVRETDPGAWDESALAGAREGHLAELCAAAGLQDVESAKLAVSVPVASFDDWWLPFTLGVGPSGAYVAQLGPARRDALREHCRSLLPPAPFDVAASAWAVRARAAGPQG